MVGVFGRSLSFPNKNPNGPCQRPPISHHIRSISLPCRSHPLFSQIKEDINHLNTWSSTSNSKFHQQTSSNLCDALSRLKEVHHTLQHILHLPHTQDSLCRHPQWVDKLLEDFLRFVDVYGIFQSSILSLKEHHSAAQMGIRKRDQSKVNEYVKAKNKIAKQMEKLVSEIRCVNNQVQHYYYYNNNDGMGIGDAELAGVLGDVIRVTLLVSVALFSGMAASFASRKLSWTQLVKLSRRGKKEQEGIEELLEQDGVMENLKKRGDHEVRSVLNRMRDLEASICHIEIRPASLLTRREEIEKDEPIEERNRVWTEVPKRNSNTSIRFALNENSTTTANPKEVGPKTIGKKSRHYIITSKGELESCNMLSKKVRATILLTVDVLDADLAQLKQGGPAQVNKRGKRVNINYSRLSNKINNSLAIRFNLQAVNAQVLCSLKTKKETPKLGLETATRT
ncbi:DUF241 domain protein [Senna tora]|uniref:DUF241 domain protein n=1 Tax=Senna tora TaxID=362788 RepID=A0A834TWY4_9FABA|nr:DUF241 domain protein [Senna tora]